MFKKKDKFTGIDFRENYLATATVKIENKKMVLVDTKTVNTNGLVIDNGRIADKKSITSLLKIEGKDKHVHFAFPTQNILVRRLTTLPDLKEIDLAKLLQYQVGESIHLPFEKSIYDFVKVGTIKAKSKVEENNQDELTLEDLAPKEKKGDETDKSDILFFATSEPLSQDLLEVAQNAGLKPLTAEIRGLALQRLVSHTNPDWLKDTEMVVDLSDESIDIHIFSDGTIIFSRTMSTVVNQNDQVAKDENTLSFDGFLSMEEVAVTIDETASHDAEYVEAVAKEIEKAQNFFYYSLSKNKADFKRIIITGKNTSKALSPLSQRLDVEVSEIDFSSLLNNRSINNEYLNTSSVAIGLALKGNEVIKKKWKK